MSKIPFNKPFYNEKCLVNIKKTYENGVQSGDGFFTNKCKKLLKEKYKFNNCFFVPSCTHALEMMAMLLNIKDGDEIIIPSYTFVSTANAFVKFGAKVVCVDSLNENPNIDPNEIEKNITNNTKAVCIVHYAGWACDMDKIKKLCEKFNIILLEDAAQAINSFYKNQPLGTFGSMSAFSFHETKNINCGEGGLLVINDNKYLERAFIIREKGTNRTAFFEKKVSKYEWIDKGSSYLLSDINLAYLYPQFMDIDNIINYRKKIWKIYYNNLKRLEKFNYFKTCEEIENCKGNYHIFYLLFNNDEYLNKIKNILKKNNIISCTHYIPLHLSKYYLENFEEKKLKNAENFGKNILRLPIYFNLDLKYVELICNIIYNFFINKL